MTGRSEGVSVPCGKCRACCQHEAVLLFPEMGDDVSSYDHVVIGDFAELRRLANGDCVYLDRRRGCTIHDRAPSMCRTFDCRRWYLQVSRGVVPDKGSRVLEAGRRRLATLPLQARFE